MIVEDKKGSFTLVFVFFNQIKFYLNLNYSEEIPEKKLKIFSPRFKLPF
jgi:hypothetical protein